MGVVRAPSLASLLGHCTSSKPATSAGVPLYVDELDQSPRLDRNRRPGATCRMSRCTALMERSGPRAHWQSVGFGTDPHTTFCEANQSWAGHAQRDAARAFTAAFKRAVQQLQAKPS
eukprot:4248455-Amphidinium_carterae.2